MANITTLGKGRDKKYKVNYELPRLNGERKRKSKTFPAGTPKNIVEDFRRQKEIELFTGELQEEKNITLTDFIESIYFPEYTRQLSPTTTVNYKRLFDNNKEYAVQTYFKGYKLKDINHGMMQKYTNLVSQNTSPKTTRAYVFWLSHVFDIAISYGIIKEGSNPAKSLLLPPKKAKDIQAYTAQEVRKLLSLAHNDITAETIIGLGVLAGLRRGEMCGLEWNDVELDSKNPVIHIRRNIVVVNGEVTFKAPKTSAGCRTIPIPQTLAFILKSAHRNYLENKVKYGKNFINSEHVLSQEDGNFYRPKGISNYYEKFMYKQETNGVCFKSLHKLRHTYASLLIDNDANPKVVQANLGHENISMTLGIYSHVYETRKRDEVDKLDNAISTAENQKNNYENFNVL